MNDPKTALLVADNLLVSSRIAGRLKNAGWTVRVESRPGFLPERPEPVPRAILIDLTARSLDLAGFFSALRAHPSYEKVPVLGFCGHADQPRKEAALAAGCAAVAPNSAVSENPAALLERLVSSH
jgi:CheY-like chemotaxis protein